MDPTQFQNMMEELSKENFELKKGMYMLQRYVQYLTRFAKLKKPFIEMVDNEIKEQFDDKLAALNK